MDACRLTRRPLARGMEEEGGTGAEVAAAHGFRWKDEKTHPDQAFSVMDFLRRNQFNIPTQCLKALITSLRPAMRVPGKALLRREVIVYLILALDLEPFVPKTRGCYKPSLPTKWLRNAAHAWRKYHPMKKKEELTNLTENTPYAITWQYLKRQVLQTCGLVVVMAPSRRIYFEEPFLRPTYQPREHASSKDGKWREQVIVPTPYARDPEDEELEQERAKYYVASAAAEQAMGRGGVPEQEAPVPLDKNALDCPDKVTCTEWDTLWASEDMIRPIPIRAAHVELPVIHDNDPKLTWVMPEREGGCSNKDFAQLLGTHAPVRPQEPMQSLDELDPTQRAFAEMALQWHSGDRSYFRAILLGTAGTGKTTTLKALLRALQERGLGKFAIAAYTGVAANNIGCGARTLTDLFRLAKTNEASGELMPLEGDDLKEYVEDLKGLTLLIIDEISMVSRVVLSQIHMRLREWRLANEQNELAAQPFGGLAVILAGDFGQLPPVAISPSLSLLNTNVHMNTREQKSSNQGRRLLEAFDTVVRLRRIHRQPGASQYKESLIRLRDAAMTKDDHAL